VSAPSTFEPVLRCSPRRTVRAGYPHNWLGVRTLSPNEKFHDPLWRKPGQALRPDWADEAALLARKTQNPRAFAALFQQDPRIQGGNLVDTTQWSTYDDRKRRWLTDSEFDKATEGLLWVRAWDFAYSEAQTNKDDPDYSVGIRMAIKEDAEVGVIDIYISDMVRFREEWGEGKARVRDMGVREGEEVWIAGPGSGVEKAAFQDIQGMKSLLSIPKIPVTGSFFNTQGDKYARAQLWAAWAQDGRLWIRKAPWNAEWIDEVQSFPNGAHDDCVDATTNGYLACVIRNNSSEGGTVEEADPTMLPAWAR
jgi:predicted phage terminase large subunit-like protein